MRIITHATLLNYIENPRHADAEQPLKAWEGQVKSADWKTPSDLKAVHHNASILKGSRVVFNIAGNKYRLVALINYRKQIVYIRFIGTHAEYDKIDVNTV